MQMSSVAAPVSFRARDFGFLLSGPKHICQANTCGVADSAIWFQKHMLVNNAGKRRQCRINTYVKLNHSGDPGT